MIRLFLRTGLRIATQVRVVYATRKRRCITSQMFGKHCLLISWFCWFYRISNCAYMSLRMKLVRNGSLKRSARVADNAKSTRISIALFSLYWITVYSLFTNYLQQLVLEIMYSGYLTSKFVISTTFCKEQDKFLRLDKFNLLNLHFFWLTLDPHYSKVLSNGKVWWMDKLTFTSKLTYIDSDVKFRGKEWNLRMYLYAKRLA